MRGFFLATALGLCACGGGGGGLNPQKMELGTEAIVETAPQGLAEAVRVDSAHWRPRSFNLAGEEEVTVDGSYAIFFNNLADRDLEIRYELRFLDEDDFLLDVFIPFNLPVRLEAGVAQKEAGEFFFRVGDARALETLAKMRIAIRVAAAD